MLDADMPRRSSSRDVTDEDLITLVGNGDVSAFETLFDRHADVAFSLAYRICGRREGAERIVQEAFVLLWRTGAVRSPGADTVRSWILSAVHERAIDALRRRRAGERASRMPARANAAGDPPQARPALEQLPAQQRRVVELAYFDGLSARRIAEVLELPDSAVTGSLRSGMQALHAILQARDESARAADSGQLSLLDVGSAPPQARGLAAGSW